MFYLQNYFQVADDRYCLKKRYFCKRFPFGDRSTTWLPMPHDTTPATTLDPISNPGVRGCPVWNMGWKGYV